VSATPTSFATMSVASASETPPSMAVGNRWRVSTVGRSTKVSDPAQLERATARA
jgi:hypothetical protein